MLEIGSTPTLSLDDTDGSPIAITEYQGKDNVFIYFMRALSCAQCNAAVQNMAKNKADFDAANVKVLIAVPEDPADAAAWRAKIFPFGASVKPITSPADVFRNRRRE